MRPKIRSLFASLYTKMLFPEAQALGLIVSYGDVPFLKELAENLLRVLGKELRHTLILSSMDLSHVGKKFGNAVSYDPHLRGREYIKIP
ncbi:MAG: hypothetical protein ACK4OF_01755 [Aquificaceae bacterium]